MKEKNSSLKSILIFVISVAILTFFDQLSKIIMVDALKTTKTIPPNIPQAVPVFSI